MPAAAQEQTAEGAAAFVKYWYRLQAHAATTGDTSGLTRASLKNCDPCSLLVDRLNEIYAAGGYYESFPWRPQIVGAKPERKYFVVLTEVSTDSYKFRESSSEPVITVKPKTRHHLFRLRFGTNGWRMLLIANQTRPSA
ncbi:hypothetical protein CLV56_3273 [Mumia flava]|uniref:DUF6318 domain-containing protein n=2 Tax=Mumia flava TaxID=1348852 RepID=A0A2M9B774_9ACTN|nr:hypothetical protein CLV56_3273 [Mumia flava]